MVLAASIHMALSLQRQRLSHPGKLQLLKPRKITSANPMTSFHEPFSRNHLLFRVSTDTLSDSLAASLRQRIPTAFLTSSSPSFTSFKVMMLGAQETRLILEPLTNPTYSSGSICSMLKMRSRNLRQFPYRLFRNRI